jgi:hypothetical protein
VSGALRSIAGEFKLVMGRLDVAYQITPSATITPRAMPAIMLVDMP